jgi:hypothetical protein
MAEKIVEERTSKSKLVGVFDVLFILVLCFATLLTTMVLRGQVIVGSGGSEGFEYVFSLPFFVLTFASFGLYLFYILPQSNRELRTMLDRIYGKI